jgi:uncharacterized protein (DUF1330 family)
LSAFSERATSPTFSSVDSRSQLSGKERRAVIRRQRIERSLYGDDKPDRVIVIDLPERDAAETIFFDQEYLDNILLREKVFSRFEMYLAAFGEV